MKRTLIALALLTAGLARAATIINIDTAKPGPVISKDIYGQFAEHLGTGIYGGMWVGPQSRIPNTRGWRNDVIGALKKLHVPLVRWPGGCFADEYHWREGIGPRGKRPVKVNTNWGGVAEDNAVGTHEFFDLAEQLGADTYVNGNLGSGSVQEMSEWLEYMTSDGKSSLAQLRRKNGRDKPFKVAYFAVGNEAWGCGGNMKPDYYASLYRQAATFFRTPAGSRPKFVASGGNGGDTSWTEELSKSAKDVADGITFHYYTIPSGNWEAKGAATGFPANEWFSTLYATMRVENHIRDNVAILDKNDPGKKLGFYVDEWGTWYDAEKGAKASALYQQNTLRDAVVAALNFNIFHEHADRVRMTNIAQMVNVLQAMVLTDKEKMLVTPTYHAYEMYVPFQDATSLPVAMEGNSSYAAGDRSIPKVSASAARGKDGKVYVALVNTHPAEAEEVSIAGAGEGKASARVLTASEMDAHNTFDKPDAVRPAPIDVQSGGGKLTVRLPAKSVVVVAIGG